MMAVRRSHMFLWSIPGSDLRRHALSLVEQDGADELDGDVIDEVPPCTIDDQAAIERNAG